MHKWHLLDHKSAHTVRIFTLSHVFILQSFVTILRLLKLSTRDAPIDWLVTGIGRFSHDRP